jgi:hypothetical protein
MLHSAGTVHRLGFWERQEHVGTISDVALYTEPTNLGTSPTVYPWTTGDYTFPFPVRFIRANTAGDVQFKDASNATKVAKFLAGETRAIAAIGIVAAGTTVTQLEGMP